MAFYDNFLNQFSCSVGSTRAQRVKLKNLVALFVKQNQNKLCCKRNTSFKIASCVSKFLRNRRYLLSITIKL